MGLQGKKVAILMESDFYEKEKIGRASCRERVLFAV